MYDRLDRRSYFDDVARLSKKWAQPRRRRTCHLDSRCVRSEERLRRSVAARRGRLAIRVESIRVKSSRVGQCARRTLSSFIGNCAPHALPVRRVRETRSRALSLRAGSSLSFDLRTHIRGCPALLPSSPLAVAVVIPSHATRPPRPRSALPGDSACKGQRAGQTLHRGAPRDHDRRAQQRARACATGRARRRATRGRGAR